MALKHTSWVLGHKMHPITSSGDYDAIIGETGSDVPGPPPHHHLKFSEFFMVLDGEMEFIINGEKRVVQKGESIDIPTGTIHTFRNPTSQTVRWLNIHSPKGFSSIFEKFSVPENDEKGFENSISHSIIENLIKEAPSFDMFIAAH